MSEFHGQFCWHELNTLDIDAALAFYTDVIGWTAVDSGMTDRRYVILHAGEMPIGGVFRLPDEAIAAGARAGWVGYIAVDDVDDCVARSVAAGGRECRAAEDIPGVGRFAIVADPQGACFVAFKPMPSDRPAPPPPGDTPGRVGWNELMANEWEAAFAFYAAQFGWTKDQAIPMGEMGVYQLFAAGGPAIGGMMTKPPHIPVAFWQYYFNVDSVTAALARAKNHDVKVLHGPMEVPGGKWVVNCMDAQGVPFSMVSPIA
jgi:predicted enzyme related to lactoylglutathione lyase